MVLKNPCNTCLVKATCRFNCDQFKQFSESRLKTKFFLELIILFSYVAITVIPLLHYTVHNDNLKVIGMIIGMPTIVIAGVGIMIQVENLLDKYYLPYIHGRDYL